MPAPNSAAKTQRGVMMRKLKGRAELQGSRSTVVLVWLTEPYQVVLTFRPSVR